MLDETADRLRPQAARCRRLAAAVTGRTVARRLLHLALEFDEQADKCARDAGRDELGLARDLRGRRRYVAANQRGD